MHAEAAACAVLVADGWTVLARRARTPAGEVDVVASRVGATGHALLAFVEVKARPTLSQAAAALTRRQQHRLLDAAAILLARNPHWGHDSIRFDVLLVDQAGTVRRIIDAFRDERAT